jgi:hypothetical protein
VRALPATAAAAVDDLVLIFVGLLTLLSAALGGFVLYRVARQNGLPIRRFAER